MPVRSGGRGPRWFVWLLIVLIGAVVGSAVGEAVAPYAPILARSTQLGFDLNRVSVAGVLTLDFALWLKVNLATALGILLTGLIFRRF